MYVSNLRSSLFRAKRFDEITMRGSRAHVECVLNLSFQMSDSLQKINDSLLEAIDES